MNNQTKEESLARWVAEKVEDTHFIEVWDDGTVRDDEYGGTRLVVVGIDGGALDCTPDEYLNCKNVAGRLLDVLEKRCPYEPYKNLRLAWDMVRQDTPAAIEDIAKACGWTAPIIDNDTEKK